MGGLNSRERRLLLLAGLLIFAMSVYVLVLEPAYRRLDMLRVQVPAMQQDLDWMQEQVAANSALLAGPKNAETRNTPLLTVIEQTASQAGLRQQISRMAPAEEGRVRVWFDDVYFDPWLRWLEAVRREQISVHAVNIVGDKQGMVDIRLTVAG